MTCIVGIVHGGKVWMGGDSAGIAGYDLDVRQDRKVFRNGEFLIGFTTSFRMGQLLQFKLKPPKRHADQDLYEYMVSDFVEAVRACLKDGGFAQRTNEAEQGGVFLVGVGGRLFRVEGDYQVGESAYGVLACGCASDVARGATWVAKGTPEARIREALATAEKFSAGVRGPFHVESV